MQNNRPNSEEELLTRCERIEGLSFAQLAQLLQIKMPQDPVKRKGWVGLAIELALGATAGSSQVPDFNHLGIELKTLPFNERARPAESTFITSIPLLTIHQQHWLSSQCYSKLKRVLWLPIEGSKRIPFEQRRIGRGFLWSPDSDQMAILEHDWSELVLMLSTGRLEEINASLGQYLQIRPKAAHARSLCYGFDAEGNKMLTLPRGFYLRSGFTEQIMKPIFSSTFRGLSAESRDTD